MLPRTVELRGLARFHLFGHLPRRLEPVAALYAQAEAHLVARTRSIFEGLVAIYDELATETDARGETLVAREQLRAVRTQVEEELAPAGQEVDRTRDDPAARTSPPPGRGLPGPPAGVRYPRSRSPPRPSAPLSSRSPSTPSPR